MCKVIQHLLFEFCYLTEIISLNRMYDNVRRRSSTVNVVFWASARPKEAAPSFPIWLPEIKLKIVYIITLLLNSSAVRVVFIFRLGTSDSHPESLMSFSAKISHYNIYIRYL